MAASVLYLAGGGVGHSPHRGHHREGACGLIGGLLPAGRVVRVRTLTGDRERRTSHLYATNLLQSRPPDATDEF